MAIFIGNKVQNGVQSMMRFPLVVKHTYGKHGEQLAISVILLSQLVHTHTTGVKLPIWGFSTWQQYPSFLRLCPPMCTIWTRQWDVWREPSEVNLWTAWITGRRWISGDGVEKRSFSIFHPWNCSQKSSNITMQVFQVRKENQQRDDTWQDLCIDMHSMQWFADIEWSN